MFLNVNERVPDVTQYRMWLGFFPYVWDVAREQPFKFNLEFFFHTK